MRRSLDSSERIWISLLDIADHRSKFFNKHGERFDRKLHAEVESIIRILLKLRSMNVIESDPETFIKISAIERELLRVGQEEYLDFP